MKNLLIITQKVDVEDDLLGFFVDWIREFAKHFDRVFVIALAKGNYQLPKNVFVYSLGKERGVWKIIRLITFYKLLFTFVPKSNGIFCHMSPIFAIASWPAAFLYRKKIILWYLHRSVTLRLKIAGKISYKIATSTKESLNIKSKKIVEVGHGIETDKFKTDRKWSDLNSKLIEILTVGRISKIKNYETLIKAAKILKERGLNFKVRIVGRPIMPQDNAYLDGLKKLCREFKIDDLVEFAGFVPYSKISGYYKEADIFVNPAPKGGVDKTVLESMASGSLVLTSNEAFKKYFGRHSSKLIFKYNNPADLAGKMKYLISLPPEEKRVISQFLITSVKKHHLLKETIVRLSNLFIS